MNEPLNIEYDEAIDVVTICGIRYSGELFRVLGFGPVGRWIQLMKREDGNLTVRTVSDALAREFDGLVLAESARRNA